MKVALCLSGHIRNLEQNYYSIKKNLLDYYDTDIFIHTWDTYGWRIEGNLITSGGFKGFDHYSDKIDAQNIIDLINPKKIVIEQYENYESEFLKKAEKYKNNLKFPDKDRPVNVVSMWYKINKCNELKTQQELENNFKYDIVIRSRPDLVYFKPIIDENVLLLYKKVLLIPQIESHGHATDIFSIGSSKIIDIASDVFNKLDLIYESGCLMNPHSIVEKYYNTFLSNRWYKYDFQLYFNRCRKKCGTLVCDSCHPLNTMLNINC